MFHNWGRRGAKVGAFCTVGMQPVEARSGDDVRVAHPAGHARHVVWVTLPYDLFSSSTRDIPGKSGLSTCISYDIRTLLQEFFEYTQTYINFRFALTGTKIEVMPTLRAKTRAIFPANCHHR